MPEPVLTSQRIQAQFPDAVAAAHQCFGDDTVVVRREALRDVARLLRDDPACRFDILMDLTAVDYLRYPTGTRQEGQSPPGTVPRTTTRFEVVYHFYSLEHTRRVRVKVPVPEQDPVVDSLAGLWPSADWFEREVWDMFGIRFTGHPNLKRLLMYEEFQGHPLRKDYAVNRRQPLIGPVN